MGVEEITKMMGKKRNLNTVSENDVLEEYIMSP
jgi:hypothetical protein